ncbi:MAG: copper chaperone PCu(A)C [Propionivibrio sp.]
MTKRVIAAVLIAAASIVSSVHAADSAIAVHDPYVRLVPPGIKTTGGFMLIRNTGKADRQLIKAESPAAGTVELHTHINENGVMKMRAVASIAVQAGGQAELKPGGYHVMLIDLKEPLKEGDSVPISLTFDDGSTVNLQAPVRKPHTGMPESKPAHSGMAGH